MKKMAIKGLVNVDELMAALPDKRRKSILARGQELLAKVEQRKERSKRGSVGGRRQRLLFETTNTSTK